MSGDRQDNARNLLLTIAKAIEEEVGSSYGVWTTADAVMEALKANGYAVVELPEPDQGGREWPGGCYEGRVVIRKSDGRITNDGISNPYGGLEAARGHASALLAAAAAAERDSEER
ncbi:Uncharacterised protein [Mycobacteroides abscessus subsp. massiliense]|nr:Uncharacterised protein [Mycobacteroides abscessus subsp. massiliense]SKY71604.1 Uncharacterised protein [Mycobacteroides abscessus subsp. massiliense]